jgi:hypothetical protein
VPLDPDVAAFDESTHEYAGPTLGLRWPGFWWSVGGYVRLDDWDREARVGDRYGRLWFRTALAIEM